MIKRGVKRFCKYYYKDLALVEGLEVGDFKPNRKKINKTVLLTADEIKSICHTADTLRDKAIIVLLYESGARPQELLDLKWKDINFDTKEVHLDSSKTERARDLPIEESLIHLKRWRQEWAFSDVRDNDFVFPSRYRDKRLTTEYLNTIIKTWANKSGIKKEITAYTFRHSRLTEIYKLGVKGLEHNKFSGHKEGSKQQATYSHLDNEDMKDEVLRKVYHIEEVTEEQKNKYDLEIAELKNTIKDILKFNNTQNKELLELKEQLDANNSLLEAHTKEIIAKVRSKH
jgi:integrase